MANDKIDRLVNIIIDLKGAEETEKSFKRVYEYAKKLAKESGTSSEEAEPKVSRFLERWKLQAVTLGAAVAGLWTLTKYSSVASGMMNMFGASIGLLADMILVHLLGPVDWLTEGVLDLAEAFEDLPEPIQKVISYALGLYGAFRLLKTLGILGLISTIVKGLLGLAGIDLAAVGLKIVTALETAAASGALAFVGALAAGLLLGLAGVAALVYSGALDWVGEMGRAFEDKFPWLMDVLKQLLWPLAALGIAAIDLVTGRIDKIPGDVLQILQEVYAAWERTWGRIYSLAGAAIGMIVTTIKTRVQGVVDWIGGLNPFAGWKAPSFSLPSLPSLPYFASGGHVETTGLAMLHRGEYVQNAFKAKTRDSPRQEGGGG
ncbi:MAG: hypothetical protein WC277_02175, partial [Bacilli bacterium]